MIYAAIVAGGTGSRMGADIPKQFLDLGGKPVLIRTIERFLECERIDVVYIGVHRDWTERLSGMCRGQGLDMSRLRIVGGGEYRNATVCKMMLAVREEFGFSEGDIIVTHDGVRPFVTLREIEESISAVESGEYKGVTVCAPVKDTILVSEDGGSIDSVPARSSLYRMLTPQTFDLPLLYKCYLGLPDDALSQVTDTTAVMSLAGYRIGLVRGSDNNIKLTTPVDMKLGELILKEQAENG